MTNPAEALASLIGPMCDLTQLPEFAAVKKYFGPSCGFAKITDDGIYIEATDIKPVKEAE